MSYTCINLEALKNLGALFQCIKDKHLNLNPATYPNCAVQRDFDKYIDH